MRDLIDVPIITFDGPSGTGKGTICHQLALFLGWHFLDSGAIYRVLAYTARQKNIALDDVRALAILGSALDLSFQAQSMNETLVVFEGNDISRLIRLEQCGQDASVIAQFLSVRQALLARQRAFAKAPGLVADGRDMGTVVFPEAQLKIYLFASAEERAMRRYLQLKRKHINATLAQVVNELSERDCRDASRSHAPLKPADDSVFIDTTGLSIEQVMGEVRPWILDRFGIEVTPGGS